VTGGAKVIGIGNPLRGDDAAGLLVARLVRERVGPDVEVVELHGEPAGLIDAWEDATVAVIVDAVRAGAEPGSVMRFDLTSSALPRSVATASTHSLGLGEAIELARALSRLPKKLVVIGIEVSALTLGAAPSEPVAAGIERAAEVVRAMTADGSKA
jgi:hydrogenase maturation protease